MTGLEIALIIVGILIMAVVLLQQRAAGLGGAFGSDTTVFTTRRGAEKSLYQLTIILTLVFVTLALVHVYIERPVTTTPETTESPAETPAEVTPETTTENNPETNSNPTEEPAAEPAPVEATQ